MIIMGIRLRAKTFTFGSKDYKYTYNNFILIWKFDPQFLEMPLSNDYQGSAGKQIHWNSTAIWHQIFKKMISFVKHDPVNLKKSNWLIFQSKL